jgi:hypothetical protein
MEQEGFLACAFNGNINNYEGWRYLASTDPALTVPFWGKNFVLLRL